MTASSDRDKRILSREMAEDEVTKDDVIESLSTLTRYSLNLLFSLMEKEIGREGAERIAHRAGFLLGRSSYRAMQERLGRVELTPEEIVHYEDVSHRLLGPLMGSAKAHVEGDKAICRRTMCLFNAPDERSTKVALAFEKGQTDAFMSLDPTLRVEIPKCLHYGDDHCEQIFWHEPAAKTDS